MRKPIVKSIVKHSAGLLLCLMLGPGFAQPAVTPEVVRETPSPRLSRSVTSNDGVRIEYQVYGSGKVAVVLVHGWLCNATYWDAQLADLSARYTVVTLDLAGHGRSGKNRTDWSIDRFGDDVAAVVRTLGKRKVVLVGHSMGGGVVIAAAVRPLGSARLSGVIGVDTLSTIDMPAAPPAMTDGVVKALRDDYVGTIHKAVREGLFPADANPQFVQKVADDMALTPAEIGIPAVRAMYENSPTAAARNIRVPIVVINSDMRPDVESRIRQTIPNYHSIVLPGTSHFLMMEVPQRFNPVLIEQIEAMTRK